MNRTSPRGINLEKTVYTLTLKVKAQTITIKQLEERLRTLESYLEFKGGPL